MICNQCRTCLFYLVDGNSEEVIWETEQVHHSTPDEFQLAVRAGCYVCSKFCISRCAGGNLPTEAVWDGAGPLVFRGRKSQVSLNFHKWIFRLVPASESHLDAEGYVFELYQIDDAVQCKCSLSIDGKDDGGKALGTIELAKYWLDYCQRHHSQCRSRNRLYPTRLMDLCPDLPGQGLWKLVDTRTESVSGSYITLSHVWDNSNLSKLTNQTQEHLMSGSLIADLSPIYQEAVVMTMQLGVRYLWIDSLCVLQDQVDVQVEASKMADTYEYAVCNLSALAAKEDTMFCQQKSAVFSPSARLLVGPHKISGRAFIINDASCLKQEIDNGPLSGRAWILQEQILARRTIYFGEHQLMWHCLNVNACETHPKLLRYDEELEQPWNNLVAPYHQAFRSTALAAKRRRSSIEPKQPLSSSPSPSSSTTTTPVISPSSSSGSLASAASPDLSYADDEHQIKLDWHEIVKTSSRRALKHIDDKLLAIAGIATRYNDFLKDQYLCGIWKRFLTEGLLWQITGTYYDTETKARMRYPTYRAPSWSWVSVDSGVTFKMAVSNMAHEGRSLVHLIEFHVETLAGHHNMFGSVKAAWLHLRAPMLNLVYDSVRFGFKELYRPSEEHRSSPLMNGLMQVHNACNSAMPNDNKRRRRSSLIFSVDQRPEHREHFDVQNFKALFLHSRISKLSSTSNLVELQGLVVTETPTVDHGIRISEQFRDRAYFRYCSFSISFALDTLKEKPNWMPKDWTLWDEDEGDFNVPSCSSSTPSFDGDADFLSDVFLF